MHLLGLPQHVLQQIISDSVNTSRPRVAWSLRLVCKKFDQEFLHAVFDSDDTTLLDAIVDRQYPFYSTAGRFRCLRGFLLRHNYRGQQLNFWEQLDAAVSALTEHVPKAVLPDTSVKQWQSPDRFMNVVSTNAQIASHENAIAMICDAVLSFTSPEINSIDLLDSSWYNDDVAYEILQDKKSEFWLLAVAARRNDDELFRKALEQLKARKDDLDAGVWVDNLADALRIPAQHGCKEMIKLVLAQEGIQTEHITRRPSCRGYNTVEVAADASQLEVIQYFVSRGVDLLHNQRDYSKAFSLALRSSKEMSTRASFLDLFTSLTQEWRSNEATAGIIEDICTHGDLEMVKTIVDKFEASPDSQAQYQWQWTSFDHPNGILVEATKSNTPALVQYMIDNRKRLSAVLEDSFSAEKVLESLEATIEQKQPEVLTVLLTQDLPEAVMKERLFMYGAITSDVKTMELLVKDIDLRQKFDDDSPFWDFYIEGSRLGGKMYQINCDCSQYLNERNLLSLGATSLVLAIKAGKVEIVQWFLEQGIRLGRRYVEYSRWQWLLTSSLIVPDDIVFDGKGSIFGLTLSSRSLLCVKRTLEGGASLISSTLIFTRGRSQQQIQTAIANGKKETKWTRFLDKFRIKVHRAHVGDFKDCRVVSLIEVPVWSFTNADTNEYEEDRFDEMADLLYKHRHPDIYFEY